MYILEYDINVYLLTQHELSQHREGISKELDQLSQQLDHSRNIQVSLHANNACKNINNHVSSKMNIFKGFKKGVFLFCRL